LVPKSAQRWCTFITEVHSFASRAFVLLHLGQDDASPALGAQFDLGEFVLYFLRWSGLPGIDA